MGSKYHMKRIIFVGLNPSAAEYRKLCALDRLKCWYDYLDIKMCSFVNCIPDVNKNPKLKDVDLNNLFTYVQNYDRVVALGNIASTSLSRINIKHFKLPHPSPRNRLLNDKMYERKVLNDCGKYLQN